MAPVKLLCWNGSWERIGVEKILFIHMRVRNSPWKIIGQSRCAEVRKFATRAIYIHVFGIVNSCAVENRLKLVYAWPSRNVWNGWIVFTIDKSVIAPHALTRARLAPLPKLHPNGFCTSFRCGPVRTMDGKIYRADTNEREESVRNKFSQNPSTVDWLR